MSKSSDLDPEILKICEESPQKSIPEVVKLCEKIKKRKSDIYSKQNEKPQKLFLANYLPIAFFTIVATAIAWEIAGNLNDIIYTHYSPLYGDIVAYLISMGFLAIVFFGFLVIGYFLFRNWKSEKDFDMEYSRFPH